MASWIDVIAWIGAALFLTAYALVTAERWRWRSIRFQLCNAVGGVRLIANVVHHHAYRSTAVIVFRVVIATSALIGTQRSRQTA